MNGDSAMIRCPSCGSLNKESRRKCDNCGAILPQTEIRCPKCGTVNPVGNLFCDHCNARLMQQEDLNSLASRSSTEEPNSSSLKGISLPTRSPTTEDDDQEREDLPAWLRGLPDEEQRAEETGVSEQEVLENAGGYPDWLADLIDEDAEFGDVDVPVEVEVDNDRAASLFEGETMPEWLRAEVPSVEPLATEPSTEETEPASDQSLASKALPDWLSSLTDEAAGDEFDERELPIPDWLSEQELDHPEAAQSSSTPSERLVDTARPEEQDPALTAERDEMEEHDALTEEIEERTKNGATASSATRETAFSIFSETDLPEWLSDARALDLEDAGASVGEASGPEPHGAAEPIPQAQEFQEPPSEGEADETADAAEEEAVTEEAAATAEVADSEVTNEAVQGPSPSPSATTAQTPPWEGERDDTEEAELPDWLAGLEPAPPGETVSAVFTKETVSEVSVPDWLRDVSPIVEEASDLTPTAPVFVEDADDERSSSDTPPSLDEPAQEPDWLKDLDLLADEAVPTRPETVDDEAPVKADLPPWLQALAPSGQALSTGPEDAAGELVPADIPDWVRDLRADPNEPDKASLTRERIATPAEPEGPLEGLPGVLPSLSVVDVPSEARLSADSELPESVIAQAQLWQQLLEQPRSVERPVLQERVRSEGSWGIIRLLAGVILIAVLLAAFWMIPSGTRLSQVPPVQTAVGVPALAAGLDQLTPGERVLVALEINPAYAEEMAQIAIPLLRHIQAQEVETLIVSTLPESAGLGAMLVDQAGYSVTVSGRYLPGNANGIAEFLQGPEAQTAARLIVLASQPERMRWWIEQNLLLRSHNGNGPLPVSVGLSATAGPFIRPYLEARRVDGWVIGFADAVAYRDLRGDIGVHGRVLDILMLAHWLVASFLVIGVLYGLALQRKGSR